MTINRKKLEETIKELRDRKYTNTSPSNLYRQADDKLVARSLEALLPCVEPSCSGLSNNSRPTINMPSMQKVDTPRKLFTAIEALETIYNRCSSGCISRSNANCTHQLAKKALIDIESP